MNADGSDERALLVQEGDQRYPTFSPDGAAPIHDEGPAWSPDGTMISFTSARSDPSGDIWIMQADGLDPRSYDAR
jgi:hypothetical protein